MMRGDQILRDRDAETVPVTIYVSKDQRQLLELLAKRREMSVSDLILEAMEPEYQRQIEKYMCDFFGF